MSNHRTIEIDEAAARFQALANPARLQLFLQLAACCQAPGGACCNPEDARRCVGDLGAGLDLAPSTVSHHLKELRRAGLIRCERRGRFIDCWVDPETLRDLRQWFDVPAGNAEER
ncbi:MAG TPA: metalloregulator ArsR/SmtB family transcription factor [bacterium]|nr:metalloregulator ArsR/SmtB family transcription factor [bacterium]